MVSNILSVDNQVLISSRTLVLGSNPQNFILDPVRSSSRGELVCLNVKFLRTRVAVAKNLLGDIQLLRLVDRDRYSAAMLRNLCRLIA